MSPFKFGKPTLNKPQSDQLPVDNSKTGNGPGSSVKSNLGDPSPSAMAPLKLTKDQLAAAGLDDLKAGQTFHITITATATKVGDEGVQADVSDAINGEIATDEPGGSEESENPGDEDYGTPSSNIEMGPGKDMPR